MFDLGSWELASYVVTVVGLPLAIVIFFFEQRRERGNEEDEVYQLLSNAYNDFLRVVIDNPDLRLRSQSATLDLSAEQQERMLVVFDMLISLLERAYLTAYSDDMTAAQRRRWNSWEDFMREWVRRDDFYYRLPMLLKGEDPEFAAYLQRLAEEERGATPPC
ncbi:MAG: hypothetical protein ACXW2G_03380 [Burkholderiaceae bacterium]